MSHDHVSLRRKRSASKDGRTRPITVEWVNPQELKPDPTNARKHSRQQIRKLARDIEKSSFINPRRRYSRALWSTHFQVGRRLAAWTSPHHVR
jgi:hypothetical protein